MVFVFTNIAISAKNAAILFIYTKKEKDMKHLRTFEEMGFEPKQDEAGEILAEMKAKYEVMEQEITLGDTPQTVRYITIGDKTAFVTGPLARRGELRMRLLNDMADEAENRSMSSLNLAIKQFIDQAAE